MDSETLRVLQESNEIGIRFLRTEITTGHTLLDVVELTGITTTRVRTLENANRAYESASRLIQRLDLSPEEEMELKRELVELKRRLDSEPPAST